jgi:hypothetical protein
MAPLSFVCGQMESVALDARRRGPRPRRKKKGGGAIQVGIASSREEASSSCFDCARPAAVAWEDFLVRTGGVGGKDAFNFLASWKKRMLLISGVQYVVLLPTQDVA